MGRYRAVYHDPDGDRYGIPTFPWKSAPAGYATVRQLRALDMRPGGQPVAAQVLWRGIGGTRAAYLYRIEAAKPKRTATRAQLRAIDKALAARRTCPTCRTMRDYYIPRSLGECLDCAPHNLPPVMETGEMNGPEHYRHDSAAHTYTTTHPDPHTGAYLAAAQVHATLARAAATAIQPAEYASNRPEAIAWHDTAAVESTRTGADADRPGGAAAA